MTFGSPFRVGNPLAQLGFSDDFVRVLIVAQRNEFRMAQMVGAGPFQEVDARHGLGDDGDVRCGH